MVSKSLHNKTNIKTNIPISCGDSDHDPILTQLALTNIKFLKPGPDPPPLPREARLRTPIPQADLTAFKQELEQATSVETAQLTERMDVLLELAHEVELSLNPDKSLKTALAKEGLNAEIIEDLAADLQEQMEKILPAAKATMAFTEPGKATGYRYRSRCTDRRVKGLAKLRKALYKVTKKLQRSICSNGDT